MSDKAKAKVWALEQYGDYVELTREQFTPEGIDEAKDLLLEQAKRLVVELLKENIEFIAKDYNDADGEDALAGISHDETGERIIKYVGSVGYKFAFLVRKDDETLNIKNEPLPRTGQIVIRNKREYLEVQTEADDE